MLQVVDVTTLLFVLYCRNYEWIALKKGDCNILFIQIVSVCDIAIGYAIQLNPDTNIAKSVYHIFQPYGFICLCAWYY